MFMKLADTQRRQARQSSIEVHVQLPLYLLAFEVQQWVHRNAQGLDERLGKD